MSLTYESITVTTKDSIGWLTLNRPPLNIITIDMMREITAGLRELASNNSLRLIALSAQGKFFSAGMDVDDHRPEKVDTMIKEFNELFLVMETIEIPLLAVVQGTVLGGGLEIVCFCDFIVASDKAKLGNPEIKLGFFPPVSAIIFPRIISYPVAMELLCTGESITAERAFQIGLINRVFPADSFEKDCETFIQLIAQNSGAVLKLTKRAVHRTQNCPFDKALEIAADIFLNSLMKTNDTNEGIRAFFEKRKPQWKDS